MPKYLLYKSRSARAWTGLEVTSKQNATNEVAAWGQNWVGFILYKEFPTRQDSATYLLQLNNLVGQTSSDNFMLRALWGIDSPRPQTSVITQAWIDLPWLDTTQCYPAYLARRFLAWNSPQINGGLALRDAVNRMASLPPLEEGYVCYPVIIYNPTPELFMPSGVATPEIIGEAQTSYLSIKDCDGTSYLSCSNCGRVGHNQGNCTYGPKEHDKVGIEIEGRWRNLNELIPIAEELTGSRGVRDGSVATDRHNNFAPYEFQTRAGSLGSALTQLIKLFPDSSDHSCGMHIHVSFPSAQTGLLYSTEFFEYFKSRWKAWGTRENIHPSHQFWSRLRGEGDYCHLNELEPNMHPTKQNRYKQLNWAAWNEHKTIECRLLPMFRRQSLAISAAKELIDIYEAYLTQDFGDKLHKESVALPKPNWKSHREKKEWDEVGPYKQTYKYECELEELLPPKRGMIRIAYPNGNIVPGSGSKALDQITKKGKT